MRFNALNTGMTMAGLIFVQHACAQGADVSLPKHRENLVDSAEALAAGRTSSISLGEKVPNPFEWPVTEETSGQSEAAASIAAVNAGASTPEFLARLAALIPVTGTAFIGGEGILLLGQKRLKVGDTITISLEGQNHELSIAAISGASFTVKRGTLLHTRPTQIASPTTRNPRP